MTVLGCGTFGAPKTKTTIYWTGYRIAWFWVPRDIGQVANWPKWMKATSPERSSSGIMSRGWKRGRTQTTTLGALDHTEPPCPSGWQPGTMLSIKLKKTTNTVKSKKTTNILLKNWTSMFPVMEPYITPSWLLFVQDPSSFAPMNAVTGHSVV
jgi:hypothetical protein